MTRAPGWLLGCLALSVALLLPLLVVAGSLLAPAGEAWSHLAATVLPDYVRTTAILLVVVAAGVVVVGVLTAWCVTLFEFPGRKVLEWALLLPLAVPAYVVAYAYTDWLQFSGPVQSGLRGLTGWGRDDYWFPDIRSLGGAAVVFVCVLYPYVYLITRVAFLEQSRSVAEAGRTLGLSARAAFFRITLPMARPAIAAGTSLALMETLADFGTVSYFGVQTFTTGIFRAWLSLGDSVAAAQLSACLLAFVVLVLALERASRRRAAYSSPTRRPLRPAQLKGVKAFMATLACALPVIFGFVLPALLLLQMAWAERSVYLGARMFNLIANSFTLAGLTALIAVVLGLVMAYAARLKRSQVVASVNRAAGFGYALPGAVIAVGVLVPLGRLDNALAAWMESLIGKPVGLILTGTVAALVYAYLVRLLAVSLQTMEAGLAKITRSMEDAARSLGAGAGATLARVHIPLLAPSLATAALLVFLDVLKELPATLALRPFNFDTLAIEAYNLAKDERLAEAAAPALVIVAVGLLPVLYVTRRYFQATRS